MMVPAASHEKFWSLWTLAVLYWLLFLVSLVGYVQAMRNGGRFFRCSFLGISAIFCLLRGLLTAVYFSHWSDHMFLAYFFDFFLPIYLQYYIFSLLILFIIKCLYVIRDREETVTRRLYPMYHLLQVSLLVLIVVVSHVEAKAYNEDHASTWDRRSSLYGAVMQTLLATAGVYYSHKGFHVVAMATAASDKRRIRRLLVLVPLYLILFALRALWGYLYFADSNPIQHKFSRWMREGHARKYYNAMLVFYLVFEVLPIGVVVFIFTVQLPARGGDSQGKVHQVRAVAGSRTTSPRNTSSGRWNEDAVDAQSLASGAYSPNQWYTGEHVSSVEAAQSPLLHDVDAAYSHDGHYASYPRVQRRSESLSHFLRENLES